MPLLNYHQCFVARKQELRELVENSDAQLEELKQSLQEATKKALDAEKVKHAKAGEHFPIS